MKAFTVLFICFGALARAQNEEVFEWKRKIMDYEGNDVYVPESTHVDFENRLMLMKASDPSLASTPNYRADSMHDFKAGLVALKPLGAKHCYVGKVKNGFEETVDELKHRTQGREPVNERRTMVVESLTKLEQDTGSAQLNTFCKRRTVLRLVDVEFDGLRKPWIRWPPLDCIYGPVDIFFNVRHTIYRDAGVPSSINEWEGPFAPFP